MRSSTSIIVLISSLCTLSYQDRYTRYSRSAWSVLMLLTLASLLTWRLVASRHLIPFYLQKGTLLRPCWGPYDLVLQYQFYKAPRIRDYFYYLMSAVLFCIFSWFRVACILNMAFFVFAHKMYSFLIWMVVVFQQHGVQAGKRARLAPSLFRFEKDRNINTESSGAKRALKFKNGSVLCIWTCDLERHLFGIRSTSFPWWICTFSRAKSHSYSWSWKSA